MTSSNGNLFRVIGPLCGEFAGHKGQWRGASMISLIGAWINGYVNNREAGDLRRYRIHYEVTVMILSRMIVLSIVSIGFTVIRFYKSRSSAPCGAVTIMKPDSKLKWR